MVVALLLAMFFCDLCADSGNDYKPDVSLSEQVAGDDHKSVDCAVGKKIAKATALLSPHLTIDDWTKLCFSKLAFRQSDYKTVVSFADFVKILTTFNQQADKERFETCVSNWYGKVPEKPSIPFVRKLVVPVASQVCFIGDIHGGIHSLLQILNKLKRENKINNLFQIIDPGFYMIFSGDYTDRGTHGVEVLYTLLKLKLANWHKVIVLKGNHEDISMNNRFGFSDELTQKYCDDGDMDPVWAIGKLIATFYNHLPVALFIGSGSKKLDFVQCCHGGIEPGYDPEQFLSMPDHLFFHMVGISGSGKPSRGKLAEYTSLSLAQIENYSCCWQGFCWTDFFEGDAGYCSFNTARGAGYSVDVKGAKDYCKATGRLIKAFFRGHQDRVAGFKVLASDTNKKMTPGRDPQDWEWSSFLRKSHKSDENGFLIEETGFEVAPIFTFSTATDLGDNSKAQLAVPMTTYGVITTAKTYDQWRLKINYIPTVTVSFDL